mmetsp:Transcript_44193/g.66628  ORF Transcript_44193/g.66628 Transcript_44193/m.66628 type:complete len:129 (+) Transcript_44193:133-519(+)
MTHDSTFFSHILVLQCSFFFKLTLDSFPMPLPLFIKHEFQYMIYIHNFHSPFFCHRKSQRVNCPHCNQNVVTRTKWRIGSDTLIWVICLLFFFWPLAWLPLLFTDCQTVEHYCTNPDCNERIGEKSSC